MQKKLFTRGQEITPVRNIKYGEVDASGKAYRASGGQPKFGEIYTVTGHDGKLAGEWYVCLKEFPGESYAENNFAPVLPAAVLTELLKEEVTV